MKVGVSRSDGVLERLAKRGVTRREFMKFCTTVATVMGMGPAFAPKVAEALTAADKPTVIWLHNAECTGCSESVLRAVNPSINEIVLDILNIAYHETIMQASGEAAEEALEMAMETPNGYYLVIEGGVPVGEKEWGKVGGHTMYENTRKAAAKALGVIAIGNCAAFGGVQAAKPNPSGTKGFNDAMSEYGYTAISIAGCPPNPYNFVGTVVHLLTKGMPELDDVGRPVMFYGQTVHDNCPRLPHFDAGEFAPSFASEEARKGWCLYELGCKGPYTYNNCPTVKFNQTNWPVEAGHPCIGCSEPKFWDEMSPFYVPI